MTDTSPTILWLRRDLRLADHPALTAALDRGGPVIPLFIHDLSVDALGAAPKWRLGLALEHFAQTLEGKGSRLILRRGNALDVLRDVVAETGAGAVHWTRLYDPESIERDRTIKAALTQGGTQAVSHPGHVLFEPWTVQTQQGGYYKVFSPMWRAVKNRDVGAPLPVPATLKPFSCWPQSDDQSDWKMGAGMQRGAAVCLPHQRVGEAAAQERLEWFTTESIQDYQTLRNAPGVDGTSNLSENLAWGEISARQCWHSAQRALYEGANGAETWLKELVWRDFAWHLMYHTPRIASRNWREGWDAFPWSEDGASAEVLAWKQGRTGIPFVDAAMREMYVTGRMHNRARMNVASYLTKHLMTHWRVGQAWFADCLTDWDPASNAMGWQWAAGSGPDAAPYFRIFNPETQLKKFDPDGRYARKWIAEGQQNPSQTTLSYFDAVPLAWGVSASDRYPDPVVGLKEGRTRALDAYGGRSF